MKTCFVIIAIAAAVCSAQVLLLSEICIKPNEGEFIEITNTSGSTISLEDYYLTDTFGDETSVDEFYPYIVADQMDEKGGDFVAKFPSGATIDPYGVVVVAFDGADYSDYYGFDPDYDLDGSGTGIAMEAPGNCYIDNGAKFDNDECCMLFHWDGNSDLVQDADYLIWGDKTDRRVLKTNVSLDGPDGGTDPTSYLSDTPILNQDPVSTFEHENTESFQRVDFTEGTEIKTGGNGLNGHDETSENLSVTWAIATSTPGGSQYALDQTTWGCIKTSF